MRNPIRRISLLLAVALATMSCHSSQLRVDNLKTEYMENPSTLDTRHPRFSWVNHVTKTSARGQQQTAYQIGVASSLELTNASNDLISAQSSYVQAVMSLVNAQVELAKFLNNN